MTLFDPNPLAGSWMSLPSAAKELNVSWSRAWGMLFRGDLTGQQVAGRWLVSRPSVERLLAERDSAK